MAVWPSRLLPRELQEALLNCVDASTRNAHLNLNLMVGKRRRLAEDTVPWVRPRTQQSVFKAERGTVCAPRTQVGGSGLRPGPPPQASGAAISVCSAQGHGVASARSCGQKQVRELPGPTFHALACCAFRSLGMLVAASGWGAAQAWGPPADPSPFFGVKLEPCSWECPPEWVRHEGVLASHTYQLFPRSPVSARRFW